MAARATGPGSLRGPRVHCQPVPGCPPGAFITVTTPPLCHAADDSALLFSLSVFLVFSDDCLWSECFLQLPGLARSGQQCSHQSDGWWLLLNPRAAARLGAEGCSWVTVQGGPASPWSQLGRDNTRSSDHRTRAQPALLRNPDLPLMCMGWRQASGRDSSPPPLFSSR